MRHSTSVYRLDKDGESIIFNSEKDACEFLGVSKCFVASCFRRGTLCKGYSISRVGLSTHGETKTKLHKRWESMIARCEYKKHPHYVRVALKGLGHTIKIIRNIIEDKWFDYGTFFADKDKTKKGQPSNSACSECPDVSRLDLVCDVCGKPARIVAASAYGPISYAFCDECLKKGLEPYKGVVAYIACAGHFPDDINEEYRADVRRMLPLWGKTEEEFIKDVEKVIEEL